jgi:hypothetical protein
MTDKIPEFVEPDAPLFTDKEIAAIKAKAREEIITAKKDALRKDMIAAEKLRLQREDGLTTGNSHMDEIVNVTIDLAPFAPAIVVNQQSFWHGRSYTVPRHVAMSLQETMFNTWKHQGTIKGESLSEFYAKKHVDELYTVGKGSKTFSAAGM